MCAWQNIWKIQKTPTSDIRVTHIATPQDNLLDLQNLKIKVQVKLAPETWREDRVGVECVCVCVCVCVPELSLAWLFANPWTGAHQISLHMEFPRKEYWSGLPFLSPGDLPDLGIKPASLASPALAGWFFTTESLGKSFFYCSFNFAIKSFCESFFYGKKDIRAQLQFFS